MDEWLLPLSPGDTYTLSLVPDALAEETTYAPFALQAGLKVKAHFDGIAVPDHADQIPALPIWKGPVESETVDVVR